MPTEPAPAPQAGSEAELRAALTRLADWDCVRDLDGAQVRMLDAAITELLALREQVARLRVELARAREAERQECEAGDDLAAETVVLRAEIARLRAELAVSRYSEECLNRTALEQMDVILRLKDDAAARSARPVAAEGVAAFLTIHKGGIMMSGGNDYEARRDAVRALHDAIDAATAAATARWGERLWQRW